MKAEELKAAEPGPLTLVLSLGLAGLIAGFALVGVYSVTQPRIQHNRAEALENAIFRVLPGIERIRTLVLKGEQLVPFEGSIEQAPPGETVFAGLDAEGGLVGYAIPAEGPGFMDTVSVLYGYDPVRRLVIGMEVLESRETPGLGDRIIDDQAFHANFDELAVDPGLVPVKAGERESPNQVETISGATISSTAVVSMMDQSIRRWRDVLPPTLESVAP